MAKIHEKEIAGIDTRYVNAQNGMKVYLLPCVPIDAGDILTERGFNLEKALSVFPKLKQEMVRRIGEKYAGRQLDALSILLYAEKQGKFDDYVRILESKHKDFEYIPSDLMMARTDVNTFFIRLYADLGIAPKEEAERAERQLRDYGVGVVVIPKKSKK